MSGWALVCPDPVLAARWIPVTRRPVTSVVDDVETALRLYAAGLVAGILVIDVMLLDGVVEPVAGWPARSGSIGPRRPQRLSPAMGPAS